MNRLVKRTARGVLNNSQFVIRPLKDKYKQYKAGLQKLAYNAWATGNEDRCFAMCEVRTGPLISIVVPAYNPQVADFEAMVYSVINQHYENWELIIVNGSSDAVAARYAKDAASKDVRIKVITPSKNLGISGNTNIGLEACSGEYIAFLDHDDLLHPCALHCVVQVLSDSKAGLVYTDEDKITADGTLYFAPFCKPQWSPHLFENVNYINHFTVVKAQYVKRVGALRAECDGAQDYDLLLRIIDICQPRIVHVPHVLYHWRAAPSSTAASIGTKEYVLKAGEKALQEHLDRTKVKGSARAIANRPGFYGIQFAQPKTVSIVIGKVDQAQYRLCVVWVEQLLQGFRGYKKVQLVIGDWFKPDAQVMKGLAEVKLVADKEYWANANEAIEGEVVLYFTVAALPQSVESVEKVIGRVYQQSVIVAPILIDSGWCVVDGGLVEASYGKQPLFQESKLGESTYFGTNEWTRDVAGLTLDVFAASADNFREITKAVTVSPNADNLERFRSMHKNIGVVMDAQSPFIFRGYLHDAPLENNTYFNPQLAKAFPPSVGMAMSSWGEIGVQSEREDG